jgi:hypothetical protein
MKCTLKMNTVVKGWATPWALAGVGVGSAVANGRRVYSIAVWVLPLQIMVQWFGGRA